MSHSPPASNSGTHPVAAPLVDETRQLGDGESRVHIWLVIGGLVLALAVATVLVIVGITSGNHSKLGLEAGKAGLNLIVLAVVGTGVTAALQRSAAIRAESARAAADEREEGRRRDAEDREADRRRDAEDREERRRDSDYALGVLRDIIANYNRLKAARRALRAVGLAQPGQGPLSAVQVAELDRQMRALGEVQLAFEAIVRELDTRLDQDELSLAAAPNKGTRLGGYFADIDPEGEGLLDHQRAMRQLTSYVGRIVGEWEVLGHDVAEGKDLSVVASGVRLQAFLLSASRDPTEEFRKGAAAPLRELQVFFRERLLVPLLSADPPIAKSGPGD